MALRIHFKIGKGESQAFSGRSLASAIAQNVTIKMVDESFARIKQTIANGFIRDAKRELAYLTALYQRHIPTTQAGSRKPSGMLGYILGESDTGVGDDAGMDIASTLPDWAPRSPDYLAEKKRKGWSSNWFRARGDLTRSMRSDPLLQAYGPIRVSVIRDREATEALSRGNFNTSVLTLGGGSHFRRNVATIRIYAMEQITPSMLPALATGNPETENSDSPSRGARFLAPLRAGSPELAHRLGRLSYSTHSYRPTLEPYLAWFLTRSIPNALALALTRGRMREDRRLNVVRR